MSDAMIGRLERLPLREVWKHEAYDFTQWLEANIDVLNSTLDLTLINVKRELAAGSFNIDLVAEDENGAFVIIENQLGKSDHDHLGKVLTYLTAMEARAAIWIVAEARAEHVAAIAWLNGSSSAKFYLVKVEAVRIGESRPAPLLTLIVGPSEESSAVALTKQEFKTQENTYQRWWRMLVSRTDAKLHRHITPGTSNWIGTALGLERLSFNYVVNKDACRAELYIDRGRNSEAENKAIFDRLFQQRGEIEAAFGNPLDWDRMENRRACRIYYKVAGGYQSPEDEWPDVQSRVVAGMNGLEAAVRPFIKALNFSQ